MVLASPSVPEKNKRILTDSDKEKLIRLKAIIEGNRCYFYKPFKWQSKAMDEVRNKNVIVIPAPNKIGKSGMGSNIVIEWALGYKPWGKVSKDYTGAVKGADGEWHKPSSLGIKPPVQIRITGEDWTHHVGQVLVPELKKWAPHGHYETKRNNQGIEYYWKWKNGSTFEILTYDQADDLFESWLGHGWWADEPPPKSKYTGMARGLFLSKGKALLTMTPLKEAWILDELVLSGRNDVGVVDGLSIRDNDILDSHDIQILRGLGLNENQIVEYYDILFKTDDKGRKAEAFLYSIAGEGAEIKDLKILRFVKDIPFEDRATRLFGEFKSLVGLVLKEFKPDVHKIQPFSVPVDWPVVAMVDLHLNKPQAIGFYAVDKQDRFFVIGETWENMPPEQIADTIIKKKNKESLRIEDVYIDPLSKGDNAFMRNRADVQDSYTIIDRRLAEHSIRLHVGSKDKDSGVRNIKNRLQGVNGMPSLYFFDSCTRHLWEAQRWVYDESGKPKKEADDMMENLYRFTLTGTEYSSPMNFDRSLKYELAGIV